MKSPFRFQPQLDHDDALVAMGLFDTEEESDAFLEKVKAIGQNEKPVFEIINNFDDDNDQIAAAMLGGNAFLKTNLMAIMMTGNNPFELHDGRIAKEVMRASGYTADEYYTLFNKLAAFCRKDASDTGNKLSVDLYKLLDIADNVKELIWMLFMYPCTMSVEFNRMTN